jgi:hypothetical protein
MTDTDRLAELPVPRTALGRALLRWPALRGGIYAIPEAELAGYVVAIENEAVTLAATPSPLDVERLARALVKDFGPSYLPGLHDVTIHGSSAMDVARKIAAAYAEEKTA